MAVTVLPDLMTTVAARVFARAGYNSQIWQSNRRPWFEPVGTDFRRRDGGGSDRRSAGDCPGVGSRTNPGSAGAARQARLFALDQVLHDPAADIRDAADLLHRA
jgi:hypothetical protein